MRKLRQISQNTGKIRTNGENREGNWNILKLTPWRTDRAGYAPGRPKMPNVPFVYLWNSLSWEIYKMLLWVAFIGSIEPISNTFPLHFVAHRNASTTADPWLQRGRPPVQRDCKFQTEPRRAKVVQKSLSSYRIHRGECLPRLRQGVCPQDLPQWQSLESRTGQTGGRPEICYPSFQ